MMNRRPSPLELLTPFLGQGAGLGLVNNLDTSPDKSVLYISRHRTGGARTAGPQQAGRGEPHAAFDQKISARFFGLKTMFHDRPPFG